MNRRKELLKTIKEATAELEKLPAVEPVFPVDEGFYLIASNVFHSVGENCALHAKYGNSFRTGAAAHEEKAKREAKARLIEAINIANEGDNGFKRNQYNGCVTFDHDHYIKTITTSWERVIQKLEPWEYIRTESAVQELIGCKAFVKDWKLVKGIE